MKITDEQRRFLDEIGDLSVADMRESGILASVTLAWAILESDWGTSRMAAGSWEACIAERSKLLTNLARYHAVVGERDYQAACAALQAAEYANDPAYAEKLTYLIETYCLTDYDAMGGAYDGMDGEAAEEGREESSKAPRDMPEEAAREGQSVESAEAVPEEAQAPQDMPEEAPEEAVPEEAQAPQDMPEAVPEEAVPEEAQAPQDMPEEAPEEAVPEEAQAPQDMPEEAPEEAVPEEAQAPQDMPEAVPENSLFSENVRVPMPCAEFIARLQDIVDHYKTLYVMGCFGAPLTGDNVDYYLSNHTYNKQRQRTAMIRAAGNQKPPVYGFDCVCLIKGVLWGWSGDPAQKFGGAKYAANGVPDIGADAMITKCRGVSADFSSILPGEAVWMSGHIGVYIGGGLVIESSPAFDNRVQITECRNIQRTSGRNGRKWTRHGKLPYIDYSAPPESAGGDARQSADVENFTAKAEKTDSENGGIVPGVRVRYSGVLYGKSDGSDPGKPVSGEFTVKYYYSNKKCGVHLADMGWVPASACIVVK